MTNFTKGTLLSRESEPFIILIMHKYSHIHTHITFLHFFFSKICSWINKVVITVFSCWMYEFTNAFTRARCDTRSIVLSGVLQIWIQFSFFLISCHTKVKEPCLPYHLFMARERIVGFVSFPMVLMLNERPKALSRIWTQCVHFQWQ